MYKQILAPLDGSEQAEYAVASAVRLAGHARAWVTLMQVVIAEAAPNDRKAAAEYLSRVRQRPELASTPTDTIVRMGSPVAQILAEAERRRADVVVLSHRRHGPAASLIFGSVADELARRSHIPILLLHADDKAQLASDTSHTVSALTPLDGSPFAEQAIPPALEMLRALANGHGATLHLTYVIDPRLAYRYDTPETATMREAQSYLDAVARNITADPANADIALTWAVETDKEIVSGISRVAGRGAYGLTDYFDFVAMATHGREGLAHWLAGSVTEKLVHEAHAPILVVHPRREQADAEGQAVVTTPFEQTYWPGLL